MSNIHSFISSSRWQKELHHIQGRRALEGSSQSALAEYLYERLNIVDTKASSLLTFNSILLAIVTLTVTSDFAAQFPQLSPMRHRGFPMTFIVITWLISSLSCLWISFLNWAQLKPKAENFDEYVEKIAAVTIRRTTWYNFALALMVLDLLVLAAFMLFC